jgi:thermitase
MIELKFIHIFGPVLFAIAFLVFGRGIVARSMGRRFRPLPAFILLVIAVGYHIVVPRETLVEAYGFVHADNNGFDMLLDRLTLVLMNFGIAMVVDAGYLTYKKQQAKLFWVPGIIAFVLSLVIYLLATVIDSVADGIRNPGKGERAELLLELGPDDHIKEVKPILKRYNACYSRAFEDIDAEIDARLDGADDKNLVQYYAIYVDDEFVTPLIKDLRADRENVDQVDTNHEVHMFEPVPGEVTTNETLNFVANDPQLGSQWFAQGLDFDAAHRFLRDYTPKRRAKVAIIDTGVDAKHEDIESIFESSQGKKDGNGHGTHCAGLAGAATNNKRGIASLNWEGKFIRILSFAALNKSGAGTDLTISRAIIDAANAGADVISMSLGAPGPAPKAQKDAIRYAQEKGAIVVAAAGNSNLDAKNYTPASIEGVIAVAAVDPAFNKATFSNTNTSLALPIAAPGVDVLSALPEGRYQNMSGTSMATPIVAGVLGVMRACKPAISAKEAYNALEQTGQSVPDSYRVGKVVQPYPALMMTLEGRNL